MSIVKDPPRPGTPEWREIITASKIPAILRISPYKSAYTLWHEMKGLVPASSMDERRAIVGHAAEPFLCDVWRDYESLEDRYWNLNPKYKGTFERAYTNRKILFPNMATVDRVATRNRRRMILECKTAGDLHEWGPEGEPDSVPAHYYAQVIWQMGVSGIHRARILALGPGMKIESFPVEWDWRVFAEMVDKARLFHESLQQDQAPPLDDSISTYETVRGIHPEIDKGTEYELDDITAAYLLKLRDEKADIDARMTNVKTRVLHDMERAHHATHNGVRIASRQARGNNDPYLVINKKAELH